MPVLYLLDVKGDTTGRILVVQNKIWTNYHIHNAYITYTEMEWIKSSSSIHIPNTWPNIPPKFNMEPENDGFQKESPFSGTSFQVPC